MAVLADLGKAVVAALEGVPPKPAVQTEDEEAKTTFITLIGHELRTPLTILCGSLQLLEATADSGVNPKLMRGARKSTEQLVRLVEAVIAFSDASTGELRLNERRCELRDLFAEITDLQLPGSDGILKSVSLDESSLAQLILLDPEQIKIALNALALNAINHGGQDIKVGARPDAEGNIELYVTDNGNLGEHVELAKLYEPFVVGGDINHRGTQGGLGLGLPLTRKLVELHGGDFEVRSEPDITSAIIRLPVWRTEIA
ncbi:alginate biosynthesis sensor protein KinB [Roseovarius sp. A-2]|nr:alginate biosynthesis sensor protein KinB [Roseovarius sp. A-2]